MTFGSVEEFEVVAGDGSRLRGWRNSIGQSRPPVLLCPGLGSLPEAWPGLLVPEPPAQVVSWYHRGTFGSARPADPQRITLDDHVDDALATLDAADIKRCTVIGWSVGVSVAAELVRRNPERVSGLMLLGGPPGANLDGLLASFGVPLALRRLIAVGGITSLRLLGPVLDSVLHRVPVNELSARLLQHSGFMLPGGDTSAVEATMRRFLQHDWRWYFTLALAMGTGITCDLSGIRCPVTVIAGRYDVFSDISSMTTSVGALPQARMRVLPTSHFMPLEAADEVTRELRLLLRRAEGVEWASYGIEPEGTAHLLPEFSGA